LPADFVSAVVRGGDPGLDIRSGAFQHYREMLRTAASRGIHSHLERGAAADILPAVFPGTVVPLLLVSFGACVLHKEHAELSWRDQG